MALNPIEDEDIRMLGDEAETADDSSDVVEMEDGTEVQMVTSSNVDLEALE